MKVFTTMALAMTTTLLALAPQGVQAQKTVVDGYLNKGGIFRLQNRGTNTHYITELLREEQGKPLHGLYGNNKITSKPESFRQIWVMTKQGNGYTFRNAETGRFIPADKGDPLVTRSGTQKLYVKYSDANSANKSTSFVTISWDAGYGGDKCLNENDYSDKILGWKANGRNHGGNNWSDWTLVPETEVTLQEIKDHINKKSGAVEAKENIYVRVVCTAYDLCLTELPGSNTLDCLPQNQNYAQIWQLVKKGNRWALKNVLTDRYVKQQGGVRSQVYTTTPANTQSFLLRDGMDPYIKDYTLLDASGVGLHCAAGQGHNAVGWDTNAEASQWKFVEAEVKPEELSKVKEQLAEYDRLDGMAMAKKVTKTLAHYFEDNACTRLKGAYKNLSNEELTALLSKPVEGVAETVALPKMVQEMVLKVKNNTWTHREQEFRIYDYKAYNGQNANFATSGMLYSNQTGPTGIHVKRGDIVTLYVDREPAIGADLHVMNCEGLNVNGDKKALKQGFNLYMAEYDGALYINHHIKVAGSELANFHDVKVHIEGGYVNGLFDTTRGHTNADWLDMDAKLFKDWVVHMKSEHIQFNLHRDEIRDVIKGTDYQKKLHYPSMLKDMQSDAHDKDGKPKGMLGVLNRWDEIIKMQYELMNIKQFEGRFRGLTSASSSSTGNPFASSHGTYYKGVGGIVDYYDMSLGRDTDEGGNRWMVAHETGHNHQALFNQPGDTEVSNNMFSQISAWIGGSHVGRGRPWSNTAKAFHDGKFYHEYDLWQRCRMYFQLYLYFHLQGHDKEFFPKFFDLFRKQPMQRSGNPAAPMSGTKSFLRFAEYACEASGLDLSEFFRFYGYFKPLKNYTVGDYSNSYVTTTQAEINASIAKMKKYPKGPAGLMFIDERIRREAVSDKAPSARHKFRWATSGDAQPGNVSQVGELGMYSDFRNDIEVAPYTCSVKEKSGEVVVNRDGKGAVGFKVYNSKNELVYAANTHKFTIPADKRKGGFAVCVAYGNGKQDVLFSSLSLTAVDEAPTVEQKDETPVVHDLDGRRSTTGHGVKIVNGKLRIQ